MHCIYIYIVDILSLTNNPYAPYNGLVVSCGPVYQFQCIYGMYVLDNNNHRV